MVLEVAVLKVRPGLGGAFESAFAQAQAILSSMAGYQRHELRSCLEVESRYPFPTVEHYIGVELPQS